MFDLKGLVNKLGENFFDKCTTSKKKDLDIYAYLTELYGRESRIRICAEDIQELDSQNKRVVLTCNDSKVYINTYTYDEKNSIPTPEELADSDELNDSDTIKKQIVIGGKLKGKFIKAYFENDNGEFYLEIEAYDHLNDSYEVFLSDGKKIDYYNDDSIYAYYALTKKHPTRITIKDDFSKYNIKPDGVFDYKKVDIASCIGCILNVVVKEPVKLSEEEKAQKLIFTTNSVKYDAKESV